MDETSDFAWERPQGDDAPLCRLRLRLQPDHAGGVSEDERVAVSAYLLDEILHHFEGLEEAARPKLRRALLTSFAFLQAQLDVLTGVEV